MFQIITWVIWGLTPVKELHLNENDAGFQHCKVAFCVSEVFQDIIETIPIFFISGCCVHIHNM